jgi:CheY-like chemotaxis protein
LLQVESSLVVASHALNARTAKQPRSKSCLPYVAKILTCDNSRHANHLHRNLSALAATGTTFAFLSSHSAGPSVARDERERQLLAGGTKSTLAMHHTMSPSLLIVGVAGLTQSTSDLDVYTANSVRETLATIRLITFDLLVVGLENPAIDVWELIPRIRSAWPQQRWMLLSAHMSLEDEVAARSLGALVVLNELPHKDWLADFAHSLRRRGTCRPLLPAATPLTANCLTVAARPMA